MSTGDGPFVGFQSMSVRDQLEVALGSANKATMRLILEVGDESGQTSLELSAQAIEAIAKLLKLLEKGVDVEIYARDEELTTGQAADLLNVSRPHVVELLESGEIPFHKVGSHRRVEAAALLEYKHRRKEESRQQLEELAREDEKLGLDY